MLSFLISFVPLLSQVSVNPAIPAPPHLVAPARPMLRQPCLPKNPGSPVYGGELDVSSLVSCGAVGTSAYPWSGAVSPDGKVLYATLSGSFGGDNCLVAKFDLATNQLLTTISVGLFPEEIAFKTGSGGSVQRGFVTNSSSGSVSVFDGNDQVFATIPLPDPLGLGTAYPFGIVASPDQSRVYVGTLDGSGNVYAIDTASLSLVPSETLSVPGTHGRMAFFGSTLIVTVTEYDPTFSFSIAKVVFVNPSSPAGAATVVLPTATNFPSAQDVAVRCDGRAYVAGIDLGSEVFVLNAKTKTLLHSFPSGTAMGFHQGIGLSSGGLLAVADFVSDEISFFNVWNEQPISLLDLTTLPAFVSYPLELVFSKDGKKLFVPMHASDNVARFQIP